MFTKALAVEWGDRNVRVNCLCPGFIDTALARDFQTSVRQYAIPATPLRRYGSGVDIKGVAAFLASDASMFVTGQLVMVDGGFSAN